MVGQLLLLSHAHTFTASRTMREVFCLVNVLTNFNVDQKMSSLGALPQAVRACKNVEIDITARE
jgi:hypothetical protein